MTEAPDEPASSTSRTAWVARGQALASLVQADANLSRELADALPDMAGDLDWLADVEVVRV